MNNHVALGFPGRLLALVDDDEFGQRYAIPIVVRGVTVLSGWLLRPDGTLALVTPFAGFGREKQEGPT